MKVILAHRGVTYNFIENSLEAFCEIFNYKSNKFHLGIELDINLSLDNMLFIYHDKCINNIKLGNLTYSEIKLLNNNIPLLEDILDKFSHTKYIINIEIKNHLDPTSIASYCDLISKLIKKYNVQYFFSSFDSEICRIIKNKNHLCHKLSDKNELNGDIVHYSEINKDTKGVYTIYDKDFNEKHLCHIKNINILITDDIKKLMAYLD